MSKDNEAIGVLGSYRPQRSAMDKMMQQEFGGSLELYVGSSVGVLGPREYEPRSAMDIMMQKEFNPYYKRDMMAGNANAVASTNKKYCVSPNNCIPLENYNYSRGAPKGIASINADPYNPLSGSVQFVPLS